MGTIEVRSLLNPVVALYDESESDLAELIDEQFSSVPENYLASWRYAHLKRAIDVVGSLTLFAAFAVPGLACALTILLTSKGPVFYRETRIGRHGRPFRIWKFRTMCHKSTHNSPFDDNRCSSEDLMRWRIDKTGPDPRITPAGRFMRRWSLDEIPQILNVIRGEMSLIGPRPVVDAEVPLYGELQHFYLAARPGLSGLWQVSGRSNVSFAARAYLDAQYVCNWSLRKDISLLMRTVPAVLSRVGAR